MPCTSTNILLGLGKGRDLRRPRSNPIPSFAAGCFAAARAAVGATPRAGAAAIGLHAPRDLVSAAVMTAESHEFKPHTQRKTIMKVLVINNHGGGFADYVEVSEGTTVRDLFHREVRSGKAEDYLIRVNRQPSASDQVLQEGDRLSFTPVKIEGAW
jgi:hypothetical protein